MSSPCPPWRPPPEALALERDEVHVWRVSLARSASRLERLRQTLAEDELERASRFHFQKDRERFIVARGVLRTLLGRYLNERPAGLRFGYSPHGKPALATESGEDALRFNVSHSGGLALIAVARGRQVGVDLERIRPDLANEGLARRFFSPREVAALAALPPSLQAAAFFSCWTRKEAYIKARGEGLSLPLDQFDVSLVPGEPAALLDTRSDPPEASRWSLHDLNPGPGYAAALAVEGQAGRLRCWDRGG